MLLRARIVARACGGAKVAAVTVLEVSWLDGAMEVTAHQRPPREMPTQRAANDATECV
jgi:hypothetical protein